MSFSESIRTCLNKYATFSGRARRSEYWWFTLFTALVGLATWLTDYALGTSFINLATSLALLLPGIAVLVRRLHDTGRSAWWLLLYLVPIAGPIAILVFSVFDSTRGPNAYGPSPKYAGSTPSIYGGPQEWDAPRP